LQSRSLLFLRARISSDDSEDEILDKLQEAYPDPFLASEALDFLIETSSGELTDKLVEAKKKFLEMYGKEVLAGKNIQLQAREFAQTGVGTPSKLRELYKDVTNNPKDAATQFAELSKNYSFDKLKIVIAFVLHSLGSDLKSKGPSIDPGELARLLDEARSMQAILGVYRFFKSRMRLILSSFEKDDLVLPPRITFEQLSKLFISFLMERFPTSDRLLQIGSQMGLSDTLLAELIIFAQMRDAIRQISPKLFRGEQHRQDILSIFLEVLEQLEEELDEKDDEDEKETPHE
jgi:type III secretion protein W